MESIDLLQSIVSIQVNQEKYKLNELIKPNIVQKQDGEYIIFLEGKSIEIQLTKSDSNKHYLFKIDQKPYEVYLDRLIDLRTKEMGYDQMSHIRIESVVAPMPGLVKKVMVSIGDEVIAGQALLTLEAMKMENLIKSPHAGRIKNISVSPGVAVDKSQILISF